ncbi:MAG: hypothetical protein MPJ50_15770 [Pirellulales bacterium]|nr:hypothetical protein [Pirellulales bacterium]
MAVGDLREAVLAHARLRYPETNDFRIGAVVDDFLGGTLLTVMSTDEDGDEAEDIAFVKDDTITLFADAEELAKTLRGRGHKPGLERLIRVGAVSGVLAIGMLGTICYLAVTEKSIPDVLSSGLGLVIGFYFGNQVRRH